MSAAAAELGLNRSTVSRAVAGKYVVFDNRVFAASDLFSRAGKGERSQEQVCVMLRGILLDQSNKKPVSDRALAELLESQFGVSISRRTVNKYRAILARSVSMERNGL
jgi:RNA polymerase sigma-54 factor